ncbi:MAG: helix-turn-helix transcriptional regulator [Clostridia bacterium]|nr:helix-turn-helix transcriptional regulator [Clostridia bacterium]
MSNFAERLKELRIEKRLSQEEVAKSIGVSQAAIARWERGLQIPNVDYAVTIAKFFNVSTDYLLGVVDY